jgi:hypothetical protein
LKNTGNWGDQLHLRSPKEEFHSWDANASAPDWAAMCQSLKNLERQQLTLMEMLQVNNRLSPPFIFEFDFQITVWHVVILFLHLRNGFG